MIAKQKKLEIIAHTKIAAEHYMLTLGAPANFCEVEPGQFLHIRIAQTNHPLLRRPLSIHRVRSNTKRPGRCWCELDIVYAAKGMGTKLLAQKKPGEYLDVLGPLGNGFSYKNELTGASSIVLLAGGMGVAPLGLLADRMYEQLRRNRKKPSPSLYAIIGGASSKHIFCEEHFKKIGCHVLIATDDGSRGFTGTAVDAFSKKIIARLTKPGKKNSAAVYACGPRAMLAALSRLCVSCDLPLQVSLEEFMGCGIGACLGCVIKTTGGYKRVCTDGPVFSAKDINWQA